MFSGLVFRHASSAFTATRHSGERLSTILLPAATPRRGSFTYPAAVTSTARPARCVSNPRKRPAATDTNPANAVWPARADRLWKFAGVLGRSPDKGRPRFSSSPNLPARALPAKPFMRIALFAASSGATCLRCGALSSAACYFEENRHPSLGPSDPEGSGVPSFLSLQLFSDRSAS